MGKILSYPLLLRYLFSCYPLVMVGHFRRNENHHDRFTRQNRVGNGGANHAASLILPDFITKLLLKDDSAIMDNYLKTRPVKEETWNKFVMISTFFDFFNLSWSLPLAVFLFFAAPPLVALLSAFCCLWCRLSIRLPLPPSAKQRGGNIKWLSSWAGWYGNP